ncbi:restriction endonuclease subunit S [Porphyromonadaceae sp. NP-X]|nr:restriction endonuclease subunit S [Porphyromonadaceae sp. NP-X]
MNENNENKLVPRLRFPEFLKEGNWEDKILKQVSDVTSGQSPSGESYNEEGIGTPFYQGKTDFGDIFLKEPTKWTTEPTKFANADEILMSVRAPVGALNISTQKICIGRGLAAIQPKVNKWFLYYFLSRIKDRIIGNGGSVFDSINKEQIEKISVLIPQEQKEQQKIAACLSSLDDVITAESKKLEVLKEHKKGLLQNLFPQEGETVPKLRFKEFENSGEWEVKTLGEVFTSFSGGTPSTSKKMYYEGSIPFIRSAEINKTSTELFLTDLGLRNSSAKMVSKGDLLVALYGANSGDVAISKIEGAINQAILCLKSEFSNSFVYHYLSGKKSWIVSKYIQGGQGNLSGEIVKSISVSFPSKPEQQKIAACLSSIDDLINAQSQKIETLKLHKKGLLQGLFPDVNEHNG